VLAVGAVQDRTSTGGLTSRITEMTNRELANTQKIGVHLCSLLNMDLIQREPTKCNFSGTCSPENLRLNSGRLIRMVSRSTGCYRLLFCGDVQKGAWPKPTTSVRSKESHRRTGRHIGLACDARACLDIFRLV
jgi:hypothetical protein